MNSQDAEINGLAQRQILHVVERKLVQADAAGVFPTPLDRVAEVAGIQEIIDLSDMPEAMLLKKPKALWRILGAYAFRARTAFVDLSQPLARVRFVKAHETGHLIIPWHEDSYYFDDEGRLFRNTEELLELEANFAAAHLIFQGPRFFERALDFERSINTPIAIADEFGASLHATIRYYVERHPDPIAAVIAGRFRRANGTVPIWASIESPTFRSSFGRLKDHLPGSALPVSDDGPIGSVAGAALSDFDTQSDRVKLVSLAGKPRPFNVEAFFNQRCLFLMVTPHSLLRTGRQVVVAAGDRSA